MNFTLYLCEKPSQAADIAKALGNPRKIVSYWQTDNGRVTWCVGHLLELFEPQEYSAKLSAWNFSDLPIIPSQFRLKAKQAMVSQLKEIGTLLASCSKVVIATDADREGEMIGREVLAHFRYSGPVDRLWLSALDEQSIRKALGRLRRGTETISLYHAAKARSEADWLVGMNMSRAMTLKNPHGNGVCSIGRVQTPTVALIVQRDLEIENFRAKDYFEIIAHVRANGTQVTLTHAPKEENRIWDQGRAQAIAERAKGQTGPISRESTDKKQPPPKLFSLSGLQKRANALWGWSADKTLTIAQALYESHKATTYPRSDCEFLPEEQLCDIPCITSNLLATPLFKHLKGHAFTPRKTVFNTAKVTAHHAIIPTKICPPLEAMNSDERLAYRLIASHYLAALLPDYEYKSTRLCMEAAGVEFVATGITPTLSGWKIAFTQEEIETEKDESSLPNIPDGTPGLIERTEVSGKQTKPPARYTEGSLIEDMMSVAKFVSDPQKRARLKETSGIGTEATRANIIKTVKDRDYVCLKGKQIISTPKARSLIDTLRKELPALADPAETAVWEEGLESVAAGKQEPDAFVRAIGERIGQYVQSLAKKPDAPHQSKGPTGAPTGFKLGAEELLDHGEFYTAWGVVQARIYKDKWGHKLTPQEIVLLVQNREILVVKDCTSRNGSPAGPKKLKFNPAKKPYPDIEFVDETPAPTTTTVASPRKNGGSIQDHGEFFTAPGYEAGGRPVRFYKKLAGVLLTAERLAEILASKDSGIRVSGFKKSDGTPFKSDPIVKYNARKKPFPGLDFEFSLNTP